MSDIRGLRLQIATGMSLRDAAADMNLKHSDFILQRCRHASEGALVCDGGTCVQVLENLKTKGIAIRVASPKLVMEEAPESYKDVSAVVDTCHEAGISKKTVRLRPIAVIKG